MIDSEEKDGELWVFFGADPAPVGLRLGVVAVVTAAVAVLFHPLSLVAGVVVAAIVYSGRSQNVLHFDRHGLRGVRRVFGKPDEEWPLVAQTTNGWIKREKLSHVPVGDIVDVRNSSVEGNSGQESHHLLVLLRDGRVIDLITNSEARDVDSVVASSTVFLSHCGDADEATAVPAPRSATVGLKR